MAPILAAVLLLAFANGANDNFKGVATLLGSRTAGYRGALLWATATTLAGSVAAVFLAGELLARFSGKGLVSPELASEPGFLGAVALGAGGTVLLATRLGLPTSTTHALVGALVGAGVAAAGSVEVAALQQSFLVPLLVSPFLAIAGTVALYPPLRWLRRRLGVTRDTCFCVGSEVVERAPALAPALAVERTRELSARLGRQIVCETRYDGRVLGVHAATALDRAHYASAGAVSFARGLNDTPKIAALMLVLPALGAPGALALTGLAIAVGGLVAARRVARTMSFDITSMNHGQGFTANVVTALLVIVASRLGMPVSTTHVSCGALFGLGAVRGDAHTASIGKILLTWIVTLPLAAALAFGLARLGGI